MCVGAGKWCAEDRPRVVRRAGAVGPAGRRARGGRARRSPSSPPPRTHWRRCSTCRCQLADDDAQRHPDRGGAGQAVGQRDGLADRRRAGADPRRPRLRDGRLAGAPAASAPSPAEQLLRDLRINRIFEGSTEIMHLLIAREAVDAHLSVAGDIIDPDADLRPQGQGRRARPAASTRSGCRTLVAGKGQVPDVVRASSARSPTHLRYVERASPQAGPADVLRRWPAGRAKLERKQGFLGRIVDIGAELFAMSAACVRADAERDSRTRRASSWPTCSAGRPGCASTRCSPAVAQHRRGRHAPPRSGSSPAATPAWRTACSPRPTTCRGWPRWEPGPSTAEDVRRRIPPPPPTGLRSGGHAAGSRAASARPASIGAGQRCDRPGASTRRARIRPLSAGQRQRTPAGWDLRCPGGTRRGQDRSALGRAAGRR